MAANAKMETLTQDRVEEISKDPKNVMCEYEHDTVDRVKPSDEVKELMMETMRKYKTLRQNQHDLCDRACRRELVKEHDYLKEFQKTHPKIFETLTNRNSNARDFEVIFFQLNILRDVERGEISSDMGMQKVQMHAVDVCKTGMSYEEWQEKQKNSKQ